MILPNSLKSKEFAFKNSKNKEKEPETSKEVGRKELSLMSKQIDEALKFQRRFNRKQNSGKSKDSKKVFKAKDKSLSKGKK